MDSSQLCPFLDCEALCSITHDPSLSWITAILSTLGLPLKSFWKLQMVQNVVAQTILEASVVAHVILLVCKLHCFKFAFGCNSRLQSPSWQGTRLSEASSHPSVTGLPYSHWQKGPSSDAISHRISAGRIKKKSLPGQVSAPWNIWPPE